ncbi:Flp family type IVb pilin [Aurantiacibacter zhengii]|uniref:Flp family type IVb pilin n=1 Tax=Aurantiacibacter zhengii TaxID=2307003 RepID=A0A418NNK6_9SPHN|nr:Flp family type IVb pilin [Aurantiacibacter zhengii]RIV83349.1 Flp family type IVb pilin [Aurantiacibacter zhengii]
MFAKHFIKRLLRDTQGATAVEYGLIAALIVIAMVTALQGLATETVGMWGDVSDKYEAVNNNEGG